ncbi:ImmA/IrrE family metallo-endopeptidase [Pseudomonas huaxiensis]|uniref:ImmA/IrrE family metallo-endopeptidase n=1 Tax=Pseudomonas huaxiensis TaxID=2213017 RepID=UPI000DA6AABB|nr:ImmA/IrrE family metallo-endopeptidase [Pseudomonas huaxiensis]
MMLENHVFKPSQLIPPGETISEILEERKITTSDFAQGIGVPYEVANKLLVGDFIISKELAISLSGVLGASPSFWLSREEIYRSQLSEIKAPLTSEEDSWLKELPVSTMQKNGWIPKVAYPAQNLRNCLRFFDVPDVGSWKKIYASGSELAAFRTSPAFDPKLGAVAAWLRQGEIEADFIDCSPWDKDRFCAALEEARFLTTQADPNIFIPELQKIFAKCGVAVAIARTPDGCQASGATKFISDEKAMLMLSFRHLSDDHFWFTLFHEAAHLILHGDVLFVEVENCSDSVQEQEANTFSADFLIPVEYKSELRSLGNDMRKIIKFSKRLGVSPGIVVGQLQHLGIVKHYHLQKLKVRYKWA